MNYELPALPFKEEALEPVISSWTMSYHYGKHTKAYFDNLKTLLKNSPLNGKSLVELIKESEGAIFNNAAQCWNHLFYFRQFAGERGTKLHGYLKLAIERDFGNETAFKDKFVDEGVKIFGSGWIWLTADDEGNLQIERCSNAENPLRKGKTPILTFDVWEHAYYLDYQNRRAEHLSALWMILNWDVIEKRYLERTNAPIDCL